MPRPSPTHWTQPAKPGDPCPCGSEAAFADCCFRRDEMPLLKVSEIRPPPPATNHAHPKCYMRPTNDCSTKISAEHYVSAAMESQRVSGLRCTFLGIIMDFILDPGVASGIVAENDPYFRPAVMDFDGAKRTARLILTRGDQRRDGHRISFEMRTVPTTANEAAELKDRWARKDFQRRL